MGMYGYFIIIYIRISFRFQANKKSDRKSVALYVYALIYFNYCNGF